MDPVAIVLLIAFALALIIGAKMYLNRQRAKRAEPEPKGGIEMSAPPPRPMRMPLRDDLPDGRRPRGKSGIDGSTLAGDGTHSPVVLGEVLDRSESAPDAPDTSGSD